MEKKTNAERVAEVMHAVTTPNNSVRSGEDALIVWSKKKKKWGITS